MFYCLFVLNKRNISLADYLSVVFYVYVTNYSQYAKQKEWPGLPPFPLSLLYASTCFEHYVLIIRKSELYYTSSGIITPVGGHPVHRLRAEKKNIKRMNICWTPVFSEDI